MIFDSYNNDSIVFEFENDYFDCGDLDDVLDIMDHSETTSSLPLDLFDEDDYI